MNEKLIAIQNELSVPKNQYNKFGEYYYRSCEDILEALKPLLKKHGLVLTITDSIENVGDRNYVKATVTLTDSNKEISVSALAREAVTPKAKTDDSQLTGATSSYARKYALNGLFLIDDTKDSDSTNTHDVSVKPAQPIASVPKSVPMHSDEVRCPNCGGEMWDNRAKKTNPKAPDYKCKKPECGGVIWPPKDTAVSNNDEPPTSTDAYGEEAIDIEKIQF